MAPFNMCCKTCGEYIYKGKKFNAKKEDVEGDTYLGIRMYRFYIKCTRCLQEICFKTDPRNTDYEIEAGATRNFMALKLAEEQAQRIEDEEKEEIATNPMKLLEKRTQQSRKELEQLEQLEELKDLNRRQQDINYDQMLEKYDTYKDKLRTEKEQEELDEQYIKEVFKDKSLKGQVVEEQIIELDNEEIFSEPQKKKPCTQSTGKPGSSSKSKFNISSLIRRKDNLVKSVPKNKNESTSSNAKIETEVSNSKVNEIPIMSSKIGTAEKSANDSVEDKKPISKNGLSLLGAYSGSSEDSD